MTSVWEIFEGVSKENEIWLVTRRSSQGERKTKYKTTNRAKTKIQKKERNEIDITIAEQEQCVFLRHFVYIM